MNGLELVSSRASGSERALARLACGALSRPGPRVLVGGLGFGYTLRAVLDSVSSGAVVVLTELFDAVVEWNRGPVSHLAGEAIRDPRVELLVTDVSDVLSRACDSFDAILLDVDNGPGALSVPSNHRLYNEQGIALARRALRGDGVLGVWSADPAPELEARLERAGFGVETHQVPARGSGNDPSHTIVLARQLPSRS